MHVPLLARIVSLFFLAAAHVTHSRTYTNEYKKYVCVCVCDPDHV